MHRAAIGWIGKNDLSHSAILSSDIAPCRGVFHCHLAQQVLFKFNEPVFFGSLKQESPHVLNPSSLAIITEKGSSLRRIPESDDSGLPTSFCCILPKKGSSHHPSFMRVCARSSPFRVKASAKVMALKKFRMRGNQAAKCGDIINHETKKQKLQTDRGDTVSPQVCHISVSLPKKYNMSESSVGTSGWNHMSPLQQKEPLQQTNSDLSEVTNCFTKYSVSVFHTIFFPKTLLYN